MRDPANTLNENALWHAVAPIIVSPSVDGAQPLYYRVPKSNVSIPVGYTKAVFRTYEKGEPQNDWALSEIRRFINVSIGATALASSQNFRQDHKDNQQFIYTTVTTRKLDPQRVIFLGIPVIIIIIGEVLLMWWNIILHRQEGITVVRMARITDILENVRPGSILELQKMNSVQSSKDRSLSRNSSIKGVKLEMRKQPDNSMDELDREILSPHDETVRDVESMLGVDMDRSHSLREYPTHTSTDSQPEGFAWDTMSSQDRAKFFQRQSGVFKD